MRKGSIWLAFDASAPEGGCVMLNTERAAVIPAGTRIGMTEAALIVGEYERQGRTLTSAEAFAAIIR